jgi:uncharacterized membrane protein YgcG
MYARVSILAISLIAWALMGSADSIKVGDTTYSDVYITEGANMYYVSFPQDGAVLNVSKSEVDAGSVTITADKDLRGALYKKWLAARDQTPARSAPPEKAPDKTSEAPAKTQSDQPPKATGKTGDEDVSGRKMATSTGLQRIEYSSPSASQYYTAYQQEASQNEKLRREMYIDAQRRQREANKYQQLTQRRVITSGDARSGGGISWNSGGGYGTGGYGGSYGGYGGGYGGYGYSR